jgi:hypothetical protein
MKSNAPGRTLALALLLALLWAGHPPARAYAQQAPPLPEFTVKTLDGVEVSSARLSADQQWLLVYVRLGCAPCEEVFKVIRQSPSREYIAHRVVVLVGGATAEEAQALAERVDWLPRSAWHVDESRQAAEALSVKGAPTAYGVREGKVEWDLKGATDSSRRLKSIIESWCGG